MIPSFFRSRASVPPLNTQDTIQPLPTIGLVGTLVSGEGNSLAPPEIDSNSIVHEKFIPLTLAQEKLNILRVSLKATKAQYKDHVEQLNNYHLETTNDTKQHYENYIAEIKRKALEHIENQKRLLEKRESKINLLNKEIEEQNIDIERLRDLSTTYQIDNRNLKNEFDSSVTRNECNLSLTYIIQTIQEKELHSIANNDITELKKEQHKLNQQHELTLLEIKKRNSEMILMNIEDNRMRLLKIIQSANNSNEYLGDTLQKEQTKLQQQLLQNNNLQASLLQSNELNLMSVEDFNNHSLLWKSQMTNLQQSSNEWQINTLQQLYENQKMSSEDILSKKIVWQNAIQKLQERYNESYESQYMSLEDNYALSLHYDNQIDQLSSLSISEREKALLERKNEEHARKLQIDKQHHELFLMMAEERMTRDILLFSELQKVERESQLLLLSEQKKHQALVEELIQKYEANKSVLLMILEDLQSQLWNNDSSNKKNEANTDNRMLMVLEDLQSQFWNHDMLLKRNEAAKNNAALMVLEDMQSQFWNHDLLLKRNEGAKNNAALMVLEDMQSQFWNHDLLLKRNETAKNNVTLMVLEDMQSRLLNDNSNYVINLNRLSQEAKHHDTENNSIINQMTEEANANKLETIRLLSLIEIEKKNLRLQHDLNDKLEVQHVLQQTVTKVELMDLQDKIQELTSTKEAMTGVMDQLQASKKSQLKEFNESTAQMTSQLSKEKEEHEQKQRELATLMLQLDELKQVNPILAAARHLLTATLAAHPPPAVLETTSTVSATGNNDSLNNDLSLAKEENKGDSQTTEGEEAKSTAAVVVPQLSLLPPPPPILLPHEAAALSGMRMILEQEEARLKTHSDELSQVNISQEGNLQKAIEKEKSLNRAKAITKSKIKDWLIAFETANGRPPTTSEKEGEKELYLNYKQANKLHENSLKAVELLKQKTSQASTLRSVTDAEYAETKRCMKEIDRLCPLAVAASSTLLSTARLLSPRAATTSKSSNDATGSSSVGAGAGKDKSSSATTATAEKKTTESEAIALDGVPSANTDVTSNSAEGIAVLTANQDMTLESQSQFQTILQSLEQRLEKLSEEKEDSEYALQSKVSELQNEKAELQTQVIDLNAEKSELESRLETVLSVKRTDLVKKYEDEIASLRKSLLDATEQSVMLRTEKTKNDVKINELKNRAERAEEELSQRDAIEISKLNPNEEKTLLKKKVTKQRDEIIQGNKATTAGWDAAAEADERLEIAVEKAYDKGVLEGRNENRSNMAALNLALEAKETRATELIEQIAALNRKILDLEKRERELTTQLEEANSRVTIVHVGKGGGDDGEEGEGEEGGEEANQSEEMMILNVQVSELRSSLRLAEKKIALYKQLLASRDNASGGGGGREAAAVGAVAPYSADTSVADIKMKADLEEQIRLFKGLIVQGTSLWREGRKDECGELYIRAVEESLKRLSPSVGAARTGLSEAHGVATAKGYAKQKAALSLRKAIDVFLKEAVDALQRLSKENTAPTRPQIMFSNSMPNRTALNLLPLGDESSNESYLLTQLEELEKSAVKSTAQLTDEDIEASESGGSAAGMMALLKRAKAAEAQVKGLRSQLADGGGGGRGTGGGGKGGIGADPAELRKLQKKIKELEASGAAGGAGGGGAADKKAMLAAEKKFQKQLKDQETAARKEKSALEARALKAETDLAEITASLAALSKERDAMRVRLQELGNLGAEMDALRARVAEIDVLSAQLREAGVQMDRLTDQYKKENLLRKKYKNELEDLKGSIRVYARCRPMARYEIERQCQQVVSFPDESSLKIATSRGDKDFEFDAAFSPSSTQDQVFEDTKRLVESCLDGFNVCLFAYGQTGSGKTFTMTGSPDMPGLTPKAIDELYRLIGERPHCNCTVSTYFVELYNDQLVDLYWILDNKKIRNPEPPPKLDIKLNEKKIVQVKNAIIKSANSSTELFELFRLGNLERHVGATKMNAESSRSHSIFSILVESYDSTTKKTNFGKLSLVDLAGSERADKTGAGAERLKEAQSINKSLSSLGDVIAALSEGEKFIPYRNNKLTLLMQDSLGGNAKTLMFVNFSPADYNSDETITSLNYAARVKKIVNNASKQAENEEIAKLKAIIKKLKAGLPVIDEEIEELPPAATTTADDDESKA